MNLNPKSQHGAQILAPQERIDHASAEAFSTALTPYLANCKAGGTPVVLDFSGVEYISSLGLRVLMLAARQVKGQNGSIVIAGLQPNVHEVFEISRFNLIYKVFDTFDAAIAEVA